MNIFKRIFRKPAIILVTLYAKHIYNEGVKAAEERHRRTRKTIYLASKTFHPDRLVTYSKEQFKVQKRAFGVSARLLTMNTLRNHCYYHTADQWEANGLSRREVEIRKKAFIRERLRLAKLI